MFCAARSGPRVLEQVASGPRRAGVHNERAIDAVAEVDTLISRLRGLGLGRGGAVAVALAPGVGLGIAVPGRAWTPCGTAPEVVLARLEAGLRPRWVWWSAATPEVLVRSGLRVATCWDVSAVHRMDLLADEGDDGGDPEDRRSTTLRNVARDVA